MTSLDFTRATSLADAVTLLNAPGLRCRPIAGGTDLVVAMRQRGPWFDRLVDITAVPELLEITETPDQLRIGAAVTFARVAAHPRLRAAAPMLSEEYRRARVGADRPSHLPANLERVLLGHELAHADGGLSCKLGLHLG